ncbi:uncharacterized protein KZ484_010567 isoform 2-T2 [Pholidichthys leucotaenia]
MALPDRLRKDSPGNDNSKYYGLTRQGATDYLNSVLQVLFMTRDFREAVFRHANKKPDRKPDGDLDYSLAALFNELQKQTADTQNITRLLGIENVHEQRDAAEFFESVLTLTNHEVSKIFWGCLVNKVTCANGHSKVDRDAPFWHLPFPLMDSWNKVYSVVGGIKEFFKVSHLSGKNQMYCEQCDGKTDANIRNIIKHHPDVLILLLKRFKFTTSNRPYVKINQAVDIPLTLQIPEGQTYELYAVVDHSGDLRRGHYTASIKSPDEDKWYKFNNASVLLVEDTQIYSRSRSAYLLFYRKKTDIQNAGEVPTNEVFLPTLNKDCDQGTGKISEGEKGEKTAEAKTDDTVSLDKSDKTEKSKDSGRAAVVSPQFCEVNRLDKKVQDETNKNADSEDQVHKPTNDHKKTGVDDVGQKRGDVDCDIKPKIIGKPAVNDHTDGQVEIHKTQVTLINNSSRMKEHINEGLEMTRTFLTESLNGHKQPQHDRRMGKVQQGSEQNSEKPNKDWHGEKSEGKNDTKGNIKADKPTENKICFTKINQVYDTPQSKGVLSVLEQRSTKFHKGQQEVEKQDTKTVSNHETNLNIQKTVMSTTRKEVFVDRHTNVMEVKGGNPNYDGDKKQITSLDDGGQNAAESKITAIQTVLKGFVAKKRAKDEGSGFLTEPITEMLIKEKRTDDEKIGQKSSQLKSTTIILLHGKIIEEEYMLNVWKVVSEENFIIKTVLETFQESTESEEKTKMDLEAKLIEEEFTPSGWKIVSQEIFFIKPAQKKSQSSAEDQEQGSERRQTLPPTDSSL